MVHALAEGDDMILFLLACSKPRAVVAGAAVGVTTAGTTTCTGCGGGDPLELVADVPLPGEAVRFDYQELDADNGHLVIAHMNDDSVDIVNLTDGSLAAEIPDVPTARGVAIGTDFLYVTSSPDQVARIDRKTLAFVDWVTTGSSPDGIDYDPDHRIVGVSDQGDGALSLLPDDGTGTRTQVELGSGTGNVRYDAARGWFWIAVEHGDDPDQLVAVDPVSGAVEKEIDLDKCSGAHGLRLHPDGQTAFVACESNATLVRVDLDSGSQDHGSTTSGPDVLSIDPEVGWLYVAAEAGDLAIYDIEAGGVSLVAKQDIGDNAHTVAADPATHQVYFPLQEGPDGAPVLRIMKPTN
jgi:sugar lactone lactonase YvrE